MKSNQEYSALEKSIISFGLFLMFAIISRLFYGPVSIIPVRKLVNDVLPIILACGATAAILAYLYPKVFNIILFFFPCTGGSH